MLLVYSVHIEKVTAACITVRCEVILLKHADIFLLVLKVFGQSDSYSKTWYEARDYCRTIGGDLLSIHSAAEATKLQM